MITAINKDNSKWRVIFNESILLLDSGNKVVFDIFDEKLGFTLNLSFVFSDDGEKFKSKIDLKEDGRTLDITLFQWKVNHAHEHVENIDPLKLNTINGKKIWFKYRTGNYDKNGWRNFHLTVWAEEE